MKNLLFLFLLIPQFIIAQTTYQVGPNKPYTRPSQVIPFLQDGDIVEIDVGNYIGDVGTWTANNITIRGIGGKAHLRANGNNAQGKAIWVIDGDNYVLENIEFSECTVPDNNGAGIRHQGTNLTIRHCYFHDNQTGILTTNNANSELLIEHSEFARNFHTNGYAHNIYVGSIKKFTLQYSYFHGVQIANNIKSRAAENNILYNRIMDEDNGRASYQIDLSHGGIARIVGNLIHQGTAATNHNVIGYAKEGRPHPLHQLYIYNNTIVNSRGNGYFLNTGNFTTAPTAGIFNNLFVGQVNTLSSGIIPINNILNKHIINPNDAGLVNVRGYDYRLTSTASAINAGVAPDVEAVGILPSMQYVQPLNKENRPTDGQYDIGAYEYASSDNGGGTVTAPDNNIIITETEGVNSTNYPMQIGRPFMQGEIPDYPQVLINGTPILTQVNIKTKWEDGSVKHAILNFVIPQITANSTLTLSFQNQDNGHNGGALNRSQMLDQRFNFDATIQLENTRGAGLTVASARQMLQNGDFEYWLEGEVATSIILTDHSMERQYDIGFDAHRSFRPIFHATFWHQLNQVEVRYIGEVVNTEALQPMFYDLNLSGGSTNAISLYTKDAVDHHGLSRWTKKFWIDGSIAPKLNINHSIEYLSATTLIPNFNASLKIPADVITNSYNNWLEKDRDIFDNAWWLKYMPNTGSRAEIGPYPSWTVRWLYTGDWRDYEEAFVSADLAAAWPYHLREGDASTKYDFNTTSAIGKPLSLYAHPGFWFDFGTWFWNNRLQNIPEADRVYPVVSIEIFNQIDHGWIPDNAHQPDPYSPQYLLSGEYWYLEEMQFLASYGASNGNHAFRGIPSEPWGGLSEQVRGEAWAFRNRVQTAVYSPDGTIEKSYFTTLTEHAIAFFEGRQNLTGTKYENTPLWLYARDNRATGRAMLTNPLHYWNSGNGPDGCKEETITEQLNSPWMNNFMLYALGRAEELGYEVTTLKDWAGVWLVGQLTDPNYNAYLSATYRQPYIRLSDQQHFQTWQEVFNGYCSDIRNNPMDEFVNSRLGDLELGYANIAMAASSFYTNLSNGPEAWEWMLNNAANNPNLNNNPKWALIPRSDFHTSNCETTLLFTNNPIPTGTYQAANTITTNKPISNGADVAFKAGETIILQAGFSVESGSQFLAKIESCEAVLLNKRPKARNRTETIKQTEEEEIAIATPENNLKSSFRIFPNPIVYETTIDVEVPTTTTLEMLLFAQDGRLVTTLVSNTEHTQGIYTYTWNCSQVPAGTYYVTLRDKRNRISKQIQVIR